MSEIDLPIDAGRILFGLSRIGYTPASAICDLIDNSVMAKAANIYVQIIRDNNRFNDNRNGNVKEYLIIDDGKGMNEDDILSSLQLGSSETSYATASLSKFGLGLKSATFSQGDELEMISSTNGVFAKYTVSLLEVQRRGKYFAQKTDLSEDDQRNIDSFLKEGHGTIIKVGKVRKEGHPSIKHTIDELRKKIGVIYFYFIKERGVKIHVDENVLPAVDVLFTDEADTNGNLDENTWNGRQVHWIEKPKTIILDADSQIAATIEITQLPHPPTYKIDKRGGDIAIRGKYLIDAANYGFYVYRNKRLISWAEGFNGIIPSNQDLYSFRGRILIDDSADDVFNIDVKKSTLTLSDEAWNVISDSSREYKRKSTKAWGRAKSLIAEKTNKEPNQQSNQIISQLEIPETLPGLPPVSENIMDEVVNETIKASKRKLELAKNHVKDELLSKTHTTGNDLDIPKTESQIETTALKGDNNPYATKIFRVSYTEDNTLWEPYYDTDHGHCVRINKSHRFAKVLFEDNQENTDLQILFELIFHQFAVSEVESLNHLKSSFDKIEVTYLQKILAEYRRLTSEYIANMCRKIEDELPPLR